MAHLFPHATVPRLLALVPASANLHSYINWDWGNSSKPYFRKEWSTWGDAEIQGTMVGNWYKANMAKQHGPRSYVHGMPKKALYAIIGCKETQD